MAGAKAWKLTDSGAPKYTDDFDIVKRAVLQVTDIANNNNKYYGIELHQAKGLKSNPFRVFTHYGRTDDLETAILVHGEEGSEAKASVDAWRALSAEDRAAALDFVSSL